MDERPAKRALSCYNFRERMGASRVQRAMRNSLLSRPAAAVALGAMLSVSFSLQAAPAVKPDAGGQRVTNRVEELLRGVIKSQDGHPLSVQLSPTARASQGYFSDVKIAGGATRLKSLFVSQFQLHSQNVQVDVPALYSIGKVKTLRAQTQMRVIISEDDLTKMLAAGKSTKDMKLKVKYVGDKMRVTGVLNFPFLNGPIAGVAKLRQTPDHNVYLDILSMQLRGVEAPGFVKNQLSNRINPVVNYATVPFNPPFRSLKVVGNKAYLST